MDADSARTELSMIFAWCEENTPTLPLLTRAGLPSILSSRDTALLGSCEDDILSLFATHNGEPENSPTLLPHYRLLSFDEAVRIYHELCAIDWRSSISGDPKLYGGYTRAQIENTGYALPDDVFLKDDSGQLVHFPEGVSALNPEQLARWEEQEFTHLGETLAFLSGPPKKRRARKPDADIGFFTHYFPIADWNGHLIVVNTTTRRVGVWSPEEGMSSPFNWPSVLHFLQHLRSALVNQLPFMAGLPTATSGSLVWI